MGHVIKSAGIGNYKLPVVVFLTGNDILVAVLLLVLLRLTDQTVIQRLQILKILPQQKTNIQKNVMKIISIYSLAMTFTESYFKLLQRDFLIQKSPHHANHTVELLSCVLPIGDHSDEGQRGQLILCDDWPVCAKTA